MELTIEQQEAQTIKQASIIAPIWIIGLIAGIIYASKNGKSKLGYGLAGAIVPASIVTLILRLMDYGNPTK